MKRASSRKSSYERASSCRPGRHDKSSCFAPPWPRRPRPPAAAATQRPRARPRPRAPPASRPQRPQVAPSSPWGRAAAPRGRSKSGATLTSSGGAAPDDIRRAPDAQKTTHFLIIYPIFKKNRPALAQGGPFIMRRSRVMVIVTALGHSAAPFRSAFWGAHRPSKPNPLRKYDAPKPPVGQNVARSFRFRVRRAVLLI